MNEFKFRCPECARRLKIDVQLADSQIRCPSCQKAIVVPIPGDRSAPDDRPQPSAAEHVGETRDVLDRQARTLVYWRRKQPPTSLPGPGTYAP